jgi:hypothetical protein
MASSHHLSDFTAEDLACAGLHRAVDGCEDWSIFIAAEQHDSLIAAVAKVEALKRRDRRQERAREIAAIKALQKAGLPVRSAVIDGVRVEFGQRDPTPTPADPEIETPEQLRRLI